MEINSNVMYEVAFDQLMLAQKTILELRALYIETKKELDEFIDDYYDRYSGIYLKSKIFLDTVK